MTTSSSVSHKVFSPAALAGLVAVLWTLAIAISLFWNVRSTHQQTLDMAYTEAKAIRNKDMVFRLWAMRHGGVYVPVSEYAQPAVTLEHVPGRDVATSDGRQLTLRAPAIMVREMMDDFAKDFGTRGRITGLKYLNPANAPDAWEKIQLEAFTRREKNEVWEIAGIDGKPHLRYLQAWDMDARCMKCHAILGYQVGDMRGATGVNLPLENYYRHIEVTRTNLALTHGTVWLLGLAGIGWTGWQGHRRARERLRYEESLLLYANMFEQSSEAILVTDHDNRIVSINPALERVTGYTLAELRGSNPKILSSGQTPADTYRELWKDLNDKGHWSGELWDRRKDGSIYPKWTAISVIRDAAGAVTHHIGLFTDITERKNAEERIRHLAHHDKLTGLFNRHSLQDRLEQALAIAQRTYAPLAVMFIDMDRFKNINDTLGHHVGDQLLIEVASRLRISVRDSDIVARLGGDEFVVVLVGIEAAFDAMPVGRKILHALAEPYVIDAHILHSTPSIGISVYPGDGDNAEELMKNADTAMYHAKAQGRNNIQFFTATMTAAAIERIELEHDLREALARQKLELHYQAQVCTISGKVSGVEALVRWHHPQRGMIPPLKFIPVAEESGLIEPLGAWVLEEACRQIALWRTAGIQNLRMAVNLSAHQLRSANLIEQVQATMIRHAIQPGELELEITESVAMSDPEQAIKKLQALRALGVHLAIDDFGTGYSSLAYLKQLPVHTLKIDRSFVKDIETNENDAAISASILALAHSLGLNVVAEGVETSAQRDFLVDNGCDYLQGYYFAKPEPATVCYEKLCKNIPLGQGGAVSAGPGQSSVQG